MEEKQKIPFNGTKEQEEALKKVIEEHKDMAGAVIPVLHKAQEIYGYLPIEVQERIADGLGVPLAKIYGIVTFYAQFSLYPKGQYQISVCLGTACYVKGAGEILERIKKKLGIDVGQCTADKRFSIDATRCIGACGLAPVMMINDEVYGRVKPEEVDSILEKYM